MLIEITNLLQSNITSDLDNSSSLNYLITIDYLHYIF